MSTSHECGSVVIQGFSVVPVKFSEKCKAAHYLYLKEHAVRDNDEHKPKNRTLFVLSVPPYCTEECLRRLFAQCGKVQRVYIHKKPTASLPVLDTSKYFPVTPPIQGFKVAYIVFKDPKSIQRAKNLPYDKPLILSTPEHPLLIGLNKWCKEYEENVVDVKEMQTEIDSFMAKFDQKQEEELRKAKESEGVPDEEGWVTVTRLGKKKGIPRTEAFDKKGKEKERKKRKERELLNFYTFQNRENKRDEIAKLRQKFEEDKQRIVLMRASRKFRPY
ncbi:hypothetical protein ACJMK2_034707 [Sinanodonta woodiana]|uniref:RRM domain-containing protein n=1 Tax=Sinanodonta woodiana TaxID=1069815 RepID=A0ABD3WU85_SINWO